MLTETPIEDDDGDRAAIQRGIADLEAGRIITLEELDLRVQNRIKGSAHKNECIGH